MKHLFWISVLSCLMLTACAGQTPLQRISSRIDQLPSIPIHAAVDNDIDTALAWVNGPDAPTDPQQLFEAKQCPTALDFIRKGNREDIAEIQQLTAEIDAKFQGLSDGKPPTILTDALIYKYGKGKTGSPQARIDALKDRIFQRYIFGRNSCAGLFSGVEQFGVEAALKYFGGGL
jgi:hypothetical protein